MAATPKFIGEQKRRLSRLYKGEALDYLLAKFGDDTAFMEMPELMTDVEMSGILGDYIAAYKEWSLDENIGVHCESILAEHIDKYAI